MSQTERAQVRKSSVLLVSALALVVGLFAYVVIRWPDNFFADDSYFYFQVAWNIARGLGSTFNNVMPTNGYHPLWMLVCVAVFKLIPSKPEAVHGIGAAITLFDCAGLVILYRLIARIADSMWWPGFFLYVPFLFLSQLGTEGAPNGFFLVALALATYELTRSPTAGRAFLFALCGSLAVLSRLDNIFIVGLVFLAVFFAAPIDFRAGIRRMLLVCLPLYAVLWGGYVASNLLWFGTIQPISGMLKAHPHGEPKHLYSPPHVAILGLVIIIPCILILARFRRDTFFRVFELPCAVGVFIHAIYITVVMSSETRWSWYYTSWMLLSAILLCRVCSVAFAGMRDSVRNGVAVATLICLLLVWTRGSYGKFAHAEPDAVGIGYQENMSDRAHLHTVLAFDKPGRMAYYSDVQIVALDGLMGDLKFQKDLASEGIAAFDRQNHVDGFVGPPQPMDATAKKLFCDSIYLSALQFHCIPAGPAAWTVDRVEIFARLSGASAGSLPLAPENMVWDHDRDVAVWRLP